MPITADTIDSIEPVVERLRELTGSGDGLELGRRSGRSHRRCRVRLRADRRDAAARDERADSRPLLLLYRSPVIALVPLLVVALAYVVVAAFVYGLVEAGAITVNGR